MKLTRPTLGLLLLLLAPALSAQIEIVRVWPGFRTTESFTALREYFGGAPHAATEAALRSQAGQRSGYYWLIRTKAGQHYSTVEIRLEVAREGDTTAEVHSFTTPIEEGNHALHVGLTGSDWTNETEAPIAWRITILDATGHILVQSASYLWNDSAS